MSKLTVVMVMMGALGSAGWPGRSAGAVEAQKLVLTGSSTLAPLAAEIGKRFEALHPGVRVDVQSGGSARGIADARSGLADIGLVSRALKADEGDLRSFTLARDGIGIILHRANPITAITESQIIAIYTGRLRNWKEMGGVDVPITVVNTTWKVSDFADPKI